MVGLSAAITVVFIMLRQHSVSASISHVTAPPLICRTNLYLLDGRLCVAGQTNPFTGITVDYFTDGRLRSRSSVSNGLFEGLSEGWHTNGQLQVTEYFKRSISNGLRTKWYPNGRKLSEGQIAEGKFEGRFRRWSDSGALAEELDFRNGELNGIASAYFESGCLKAWARMNHGAVLERRTFTDGAQISTTH